MSHVERKPLFAYAKTKAQINRAADQHLCFPYMYIHVDSTISLLYKFEILDTLPFPVAGHLGLCLIWSGTPKTGFLATGLIFYLQLLRNLIVIYCCNWTQMFYLLSNYDALHPNSVCIKSHLFMPGLPKVTPIMLYLLLDLWNENLHVTYEIIWANSSMSWFSLTLHTLSEKV